MIFGLKYSFPVFEGEGVGGSSAPPAAAPPQQPPSNPSDPNPDALSQEDSWVLGHFDALQADEQQEELDSSVEPSEASERGEPPTQVSAQAERPEPAVPASQQTGKSQQNPPALATPAVETVASTPPAPVVGAVGNQPVVSQPPAVQQPPADPTLIMAQISEGISKQRDGLIENLATTRYALSEKEADDLGLTPEQAKFWARRQAQQHVDTVASITQMQAEKLPVFLNGMLEAKAKNQKAEDRFFEQWPQLKQAKREDLSQVFGIVRQLNPNADEVAFTKKAGELACIQLGFPLQSASAGNPPQQQQIRTPGPIVRQTNGLAHLPAGTSTAPGPAVPQKTEIEKFFDLLQRTDAGEFET